uniref:Fnr-like regulatory protein n=3 Tax=Acidithiobacillus TaxID=119977 RepID=P96094_ACIFI|nr:Crp/Fnr family transcriptional regulator [Acidithiobacillus ferridurans]AAC80174.1 Fnr-like regulatory protein [Acidithiobacillus ferridurans]
MTIGQVELTEMERLRRTEIFSVWSDEDLSHLFKGARVLEMSVGQILFLEGDAATAFYFLLDGQVKLVTSAADGHEKIVDILQGGDLFCRSCSFFGISLSRAGNSGHARPGSGNSPYDNFLVTLQQHQELMLQMLGELSLRLRHLIMELRHLTVESADQRVAGYLLELCPSGNSPVSLLLPAKKAMIAARLGLTPETFSRVLKRLREEHLIAVEKLKIYIHRPSELRQWANSKSSTR